MVAGYLRAHRKDLTEDPTEDPTKDPTKDPNTDLKMPSHPF